MDAITCESGCIYDDKKVVNLMAIVSKDRFLLKKICEQYITVQKK